ncbi:hypothetical protein E4K72_04360 [Oxalobacteraceae bacterium OM1]|nr:hypothetical protein E4K72_04360 [Oxalobacteraceae bacterium OM1]
MSTPRHLAFTGFGLLLACAMLAGCDRGGDGAAANTGARQTHFPGQITAGGSTSGEVLAKNSAQTANMAGGTPGIPKGSGGNTGGAGNAPTSTSGGETTRGQAPGQGVAGTPSIPGGAEGNAGGTAMGGTTPSEASTKTAPPQGQGK